LVLVLHTEKGKMLFETKILCSSAFDPTAFVPSIFVLTK